MQSSLVPHSSEFSEHLTICRSYGEVQKRCSRILAEQRVQVQHLEAQAVRLRANAIMLETKIAWAQADHEELIASMRDLPSWRTLLVQLEVMAARVVALVRKHTSVQWRQQYGAGHCVMAPAAPLRVLPVVSAARMIAGHRTFDPSLSDANRIICQVGCLSHGAYWRDQDLCRRSGALCVMPDAPSAPPIPSQIMGVTEQE